MDATPPSPDDDSDATFDRIMEFVGNDGPFQQRYNIAFNVCTTVFVSMAAINVLLILTAPEHNCSVPGREQYNGSLSEEAWKNLTLPRELNNRGELGYSSCRMYNLSKYPEGTSLEEMTFAEDETTSCIYGYEYDLQYFDAIPITEKNWVCDKELYGANIFVFIRFAVMSGMFVLGQLGDRIGRRPMYLLSIAVITLGRTILVFSASYYWLFAALTCLSGFFISAAFQSPLIVAIEITKDDQRAAINMCQLLGWTLGCCLAPLILWWTRDWVWFILVTSLPCLLFYCAFYYNIESPRWLANQGRYRDCIRQLKKIAKVNGAKLFLTEEFLQTQLQQKRVEKTYGMASLFSDWHLIKLTFLLMVCSICNAIPMDTLFFISLKMDGNPFLNNFWQAAVELPAYFCGQILCDRLGRRITQSSACFGIALSCAPVLFMVHHKGSEQYATILTIVIKFFVCVVSFVLILQPIEIFPTVLRQTGYAVTSLVSNSFAALAPYVVYLGTNYDMRLPFAVMGLLGLVGMLTASFLPETLYQKLPETMEEARRFGRDQSYWSLPRKPRNLNGGCEEHLNPNQYEMR